MKIEPEDFHCYMVTKGIPYDMAKEIDLILPEQTKQRLMTRFVYKYVKTCFGEKANTI